MTNIDVKNQTSDRILILKVKPGKEGTNSKGLTDPRLFKGENRLHAFVDPVTMLWRLRYDFGIIPDEFRRSWTKFNLLLEFVTKYYEQRNIDIVDIQSAPSS